MAPRPSTAAVAGSLAAADAATGRVAGTQLDVSQLTVVEEDHGIKKGCFTVFDIEICIICIHMCIDLYIYIYLYIRNCKLYVHTRWDNVHTRWDNPGFGMAAAVCIFCGYKMVEVYKSMFKRLERTHTECSFLVYSLCIFCEPIQFFWEK